MKITIPARDEYLELLTFSDLLRAIRMKGTTPVVYVNAFMDWTPVSKALAIAYVTEWRGYASTDALESRTSAVEASLMDDGTIRISRAC